MFLNIGHCIVELIFVSMGSHELLDLKCHTIEAILVNKDHSTLTMPWEYRAEVLKALPHLKEYPVVGWDHRSAELSFMDAFLGWWCGGALSSESAAEAAERGCSQGVLSASPALCLVLQKKLVLKNYDAPTLSPTQRRRSWLLALSFPCLGTLWLMIGNDGNT